jgi:teichuronic acid biosynthesis glycosyltransferase TuaC
LRVAVVAEYYPRPSHPGLGIWAHKQALAVRDEGIDVRALVLERPLPPLAVLRAVPNLRPLREWARGVRAQRGAATLDEIPVHYVRFLSPPRPLSYGNWGAWAAPAIGRALNQLDRSWPVDLVHAHYAVPAGDAVRRWIARRANNKPLVVSVHGGDLSFAALQSERGRRAVVETLRTADAVIVNSELTGEGVKQLTGRREGISIVHPGAELTAQTERHSDPTLVTVANLESHKSQAEVIRALAALAPRHSRLRYTLVGKGPDRAELEALARSLGVAERVRFTEALPHDEALAELGRCHLHVMPSRHDGFGVAHIEAMGAGLPTIGGRGTGAEDIARAGDGIILVAAGDLAGLVRTIDELVSDPERCRKLGERGRKTVVDHFSWERNGRQTAAIYRSAAPVGTT